MRGYLGNQSRGGGQGGQQGGGQGGGGRSNRSNRQRNDNRNGNTNGGRPAHEDYGDLPEGGDDLEIRRGLFEAFDSLEPLFGIA